MHKQEALGDRIHPIMMYVPRLFHDPIPNWEYQEDTY